MLSKTAVTEAIRRHGQAPLIYLGTALALVSAGTAAAATAAPAAASAHEAAVPAAASRAATAPAAGRAAAGHQATVRHSPARPATPLAGTAGKRRQVRVEQAKASPEPKAAAADRKPASAAAHKPATAADRKPAIVPLADRLLTGPVTGPQEWMPMTPARWQNAATIVRQALSKHLGVRSAVIAVATSMQEAMLENIGYGDRDSLGLFQQRPSTGWGSPGQIMDPAYAADAFLSALHAHQQADPSWASQPLWENAQAVQNSGFPTAYAKWEAQAASLVKDVTAR